MFPQQCFLVRPGRVYQKMKIEPKIAVKIGKWGFDFCIQLPPVMSPWETSAAAIDLMHNDVTRLDAREECWS
jgi:hypothetical protein